MLAFGYARKPPGGPFAALGLASRAQRQLDQAGAEVGLQLLASEVKRHCGHGRALAGQPRSPTCVIRAWAARDYQCQLDQAGAEVYLQLLVNGPQLGRRAWAQPAQIYASGGPLNRPHHPRPGRCLAKSTARRLECSSSSTPARCSPFSCRRRAA